MSDRFRTQVLMSLTFLFAVASLSLMRAQEPTKDSLDVVKKAVADKKATLLDVREKVEWDDGHLKAAKFLALSELENAKADDLARLLSKDQIVYCHCAAGKRALKAAELLRKHGYDARALKQGYQELLKSGFAPDAK